MSSNVDFVEYACAQMSGAGAITHRKMFGEYGIYCDGKFVAAVCDNQMFLKITEAGEKLVPKCEKALPYQGATSYYFVLDSILDDAMQVSKVVRATCDALPMPKPKKPKK